MFMQFGLVIDDKDVLDIVTQCIDVYAKVAGIQPEGTVPQTSAPQMTAPAPQVPVAQMTAPMHQGAGPMTAVPPQAPQMAAPVQVPAPQTAAPVQAPAPPTAAPVQQGAVPTATRAYSLDELAQAAIPLMERGMQAQLQELLAGYGVVSLPDLRSEQYGSFATALRGMGAMI